MYVPVPVEGTGFTRYSLIQQSEWVKFYFYNFIPLKKAFVIWRVTLRVLLINQMQFSLVLHLLHFLVKFFKCAVNFFKKLNRFKQIKYCQLVTWQESSSKGKSVIRILIDHNRSHICHNSPLKLWGIIGPLVARPCLVADIIDGLRNVISGLECRIVNVVDVAFVMLATLWTFKANTKLKLVFECYSTMCRKVAGYDPSDG